jgi:hypothetical protein
LGEKQIVFGAGVDGRHPIRTAVNLNRGVEAVNLDQPLMDGKGSADQQKATDQTHGRQDQQNAYGPPEDPTKSSAHHLLPAAERRIPRLF